MRHASKDQNVHAESEQHEKSKSYPCGPHGHHKSTWKLEKRESVHSLDGESDRVVGTWNKASRMKKMWYVSIEKTVNANLECDENRKRYACGPHGTKSTFWNTFGTLFGIRNTNESFHILFNDNDLIRLRHHLVTSPFLHPNKSR
jgi:hypothetical protein